MATTLLRLWAAFGATAISACGGDGGSTDVQPTLRFADRTDAEIVRLISAAGGTDMFLAESMFSEYDDSGFDTDPCPARASSGSTATITGNCTRTDGVELRGSITIDNPIGWDAIDYEFRDDTHYVASQWAVVEDSFTRTIDGTLTRVDSFTTWDADLTVNYADLTVRSDLYYHCSNPSNPHCALTNSGLELAGVGGALASGTVDVDRSTNRQTASFTLRGVDRLTVEIANNCVGWSIEGTDRGMTCP